LGALVLHKASGKSATQIKRRALHSFSLAAKEFFTSTCTRLSNCAAGERGCDNENLIIQWRRDKRSDVEAAAKCAGPVRSPLNFPFFWPGCALVPIAVPLPPPPKHLHFCYDCMRLRCVMRLLCIHFYTRSHPWLPPLSFKRAVHAFVLETHFYIYLSL
jgi:hypothetical protein